MKNQMENMEKDVEADLKAMGFEQDSQSNVYNTIQEVTEVGGYRSTQSSNFSFEPVDNAQNNIVHEDTMVRKSF